MNYEGGQGGDHREEKGRSDKAKNLIESFDELLKILDVEDNQILTFESYSAHFEAYVQPVEKFKLVDVFEEDDKLVVVTILPYVDERSISVWVSRSGRTLAIKVQTPEWSYLKGIRLPRKVELEPVEVSYKYGTLKVKLKKALS